MQVYSQFNTKEFNKEYTELTEMKFTDMKDFMSKYWSTPEQIESTRAKMNYIFSFFEGVGVLVYRGLLNPKYVDDLMSSYIFRSWHKFGDLIVQARVYWEFSWDVDKTEYLYNEISRFLRRSMIGSLLWVWGFHSTYLLWLFHKKIVCVRVMSPQWVGFKSLWAHFLILQS